MPFFNTIAAAKTLNDCRHKEAETLYVLAVLYARHGYKEVATGFGRECIGLLRRLGTDTMEDCATNFVCLEGVALPEFLHEDVVRDRLKTHKIEV